MKKYIVLLSALYASSCVASLFYFGGHLNYVRMNFNNPKKVKGYLAGADGGFKFTRCHFFADTNFEGYWNAGPISGRPAQQSNLTEYFAKFRFGPTITVSCNKTFEPYIGFGYDFFRNKQDPAVDGPSYNYNKLFVPVGFMAIWCPTPQINVMLQGEWRPDVFARLHVLSNSVKINKKHAARVQMPISILLGCSKRCDITICPFFDWNRFGAPHVISSQNILLPVPPLTRWYLGYRLELGFTF